MLIMVLFEDELVAPTATHYELFGVLLEMTRMAPVWDSPPTVRVVV